MIDVIGTDAGAPASLPAAQQALIRAAEQIAAPRRFQPALETWLECPVPLIESDDPRHLVEALSALSAQTNAVVLASGDPLWFGIGRILAERLGPERLRFHPSPTCLQLAFARIGRPWQDARWVSLHGRDPEPLARELQLRPRALAVLTDPGRGGADTVRRCLRSSGLEASYQLWLGENLGRVDERMRLIPADAPLPEPLQPLLMALLIAKEPSIPREKALPLFGLEDGLYLQHPDHPGLMTKREARIQLLADLELPDQGVLWDLGAGTGSIGLEALRLRPQLRLLAVEHRAGGAALIQANAKRLEVMPSAVMEADALSLLSGNLPEGLDQPDRVLLGGGGIHRDALLKVVLRRLRPSGIVVIPLATLEAVATLRSMLEQSGLTVQLNQLQAWRGQPLSDGTRLAPMNPIFSLKGLRSLHHC